MNIDPDSIHEVRDIYHLSDAFLCKILDQVYIDSDYLKCKFEFDDNELRCLSDCKIEIIWLITRAILNDVCAKDLCV